ncbi:MAG: hypothetical protein EOO05_16700, partial [Chitinophagaceae bacterium]
MGILVGIGQQVKHDFFNLVGIKMQHKRLYPRMEIERDIFLLGNIGEGTTDFTDKTDDVTGHRVKPELVAYGEDGSSGAAAMVSGTAALIQQAFKLKHGVLPASATTKAILINSANDVGTAGIDFSSGYGNLNTYAAVKTVQEGRIFESTIQSNKTQSVSIQVPVNTSNLKVTLVWTDPAAVVNAAKALVNDLNLIVKSPDNNQWLPWVLDHRPSLASLQLPAERKTDTLNTVELVTVNNPAAGTYTIE